MSKAAKGLYVSQSALAQQIATLKRSLGFPLFERTSRGVSLTEQGAMFLPYSEEIVATYKTAVERCRSVGAGTVRVAVDYEALFVYAAKVERCLEKAHPEVEVVHQECSLRSVLPALVDGAADVAYFSQCEHIRSNPAAVFVPLFRAHATCYVAPDHPLADKDCLEMGDLRPYPVMMVPGDLDDCYAGLRAHIASAEPGIQIVERTDNPFMQGVAQPDVADPTVYVGPHWRYKSFTHCTYAEMPLVWPHETWEGVAYLSPAPARVKAYVDEARRVFGPGGDLAQMDSPSSFG